MKKKSAAPEILIPTERGRMDKALSHVVNQGESAEDALRRMYKLNSLQNLSDEQVYRLQNKASELLGHLGLEKYSISDADPKMVQKLLEKEYGYATGSVPALIAERDPDAFMKKFLKAQELGYVEPSDADELLMGSTKGISRPYMGADKQIAGSKALLVAPDGSPLRMAGVGLHEAQHSVDDILGGGNDSRPYNFDLSNVRKNTNDPIEALKSITSGHHAGQDHYELEKANNILRGVDDYNDIQKGQIKKKAMEGLVERFGKGFAKVRGILPFAGTALGAGMALSSPDASAAVADAVVPGGMEGLGPSEEDAAIENPQKNPQLRQQALERLLKK